MEEHRCGRGREEKITQLCGKSKTVLLVISGMRFSYACLSKLAIDGSNSKNVEFDCKLKAIINNYVVYMI